MNNKVGKEKKNRRQWRNQFFHLEKNSGGKEKKIKGNTVNKKRVFKKFYQKKKKFHLKKKKFQGKN